ncbi:stage II sporulation protein R [Clostridium aestuarii]|uniref:Stage II sporulation protein R n=1 Tax=Clostridium aestuarii TaxID=338193 RepID=A0ABT4D2Y2_9CLOT|nr:stage II sporulation protein R [Clostridium aestuarii]MCY6485598.1 stage II sporulation protein R [Clostridium aestuarii]
MKKIIAVWIFLLILFGSILGGGYKQVNASQETIAKKIIRFHVIANSDTIEDQALKLKVRDEVLKYISPKLKKSSSIEESRKIIRDSDECIKKVAQKVIREKKYNYKAETILSHENFPVKSYGNITLPEGEYEAYRIIIGNGKGHNWWCVMFPPLCFTDITKGEVAYKETEREMKQTLTPQEYELVNNSDSDLKEDDEIIVKFKFMEVAKKIRKKIQGN